jgi:hypothetical protein
MDIKKYEAMLEINIACLVFFASFSLGLLFEPEDGGDAFLRTVGGLLPNYMALQPRQS